MGTTARKRVNAAMRMSGRFFETPLRSTQDNTPARLKRYRRSGQFTRDLSRVRFKAIA